VAGTLLFFQDARVVVDLPNGRLRLERGAGSR
jgi:hypothetical protein